MYDLTLELDNELMDIVLRTSARDTSEDKHWSVAYSSGIKFVSFEFGSQTVLSWQKITCYFLAQNGCVYYLTPCIPLKFGVETAFLKKMYERNFANAKAIDFMTKINTVKRLLPNDHTMAMVSLTEKEYNDYLPDLQGPVANPNLKTNFRDFLGFFRLETYPQTFISYKSSGEAFVQLTFQEPDVKFKSDQYEASSHSWITKECIELSIDEDDDVVALPMIHRSKAHPHSFFFLRGKYY